MDSCTGIIIDSEVLVLCQMQEDFRQLVWRIVIEMNCLCKAALQSWVRVDEIMHLVGIARYDTNELTTVVLQTLQQRVNSLSTKGITITRLQSIGLIDKQDTTKGLIYQLVGLDSCLTSITSHQFGAVGFYQLTA